jgi:hypothetical protein
LEIVLSAFDELVLEFRRIGSLLAVVEDPRFIKIGSSADLSAVYEASYLFAVRAFEYFIEEQIVEYLKWDCWSNNRIVDGKSRRYFPRYKKVTDGHARRILLGCQNEYNNYLPFEAMNKISLKLFYFGIPFSSITQQQKDVISRAQTVRNAIAHKSEAALGRFRKVVNSRYPAVGLNPQVSDYLKLKPTGSRTAIQMDLAELIEVGKSLSGR